MYGGNREWAVTFYRVAARFFVFTNVRLIGHEDMIYPTPKKRLLMKILLREYRNSESIAAAIPQPENPVCSQDFYTVPIAVPNCITVLLKVL